MRKNRILLLITIIVVAIIVFTIYLITSKDKEEQRTPITIGYEILNYNKNLVSGQLKNVYSIEEALEKLNSETYLEVEIRKTEGMQGTDYEGENLTLLRITQGKDSYIATDYQYWYIELNGKPIYDFNDVGLSNNDTLKFRIETVYGTAVKPVIMPSEEDPILVELWVDSDVTLVQLFVYEQYSVIEVLGFLECFDISRTENEFGYSEISIDKFTGAGFELNKTNESTLTLGLFNEEKVKLALEQEKELKTEELLDKVTLETELYGNDCLVIKLSDYRIN